MLNLMNYQKHLVSVCIPSYNGSKYLAAALESVEQQTYENIEILVSDDGSTDDTLPLLNVFAKRTKYPFIILKHSPSGIGANWNNAMKHSKGEYIKFLFQDDLLLPNCIEEMVSVLDTEKEIGLVASKRSIIIQEEETKEIKDWFENYSNLQSSLELTKENRYLLDRSFFKQPHFNLIPVNKIAEPSGILFRKSLIKEIGCFREDMIQVLDIEFYNRVLKKSKIAILNKSLFAFRLHREQASAVNIGQDDPDIYMYKRILFQQFFWLLNSENKQKLLDMFIPFGGKLFRKLRKF
jgi:glycosyltransferase involved in cell wall biosynthesis